MSARRMLPFLLINVIVSAVVVLAILYFWETRRAETTPAAASLAGNTEAAATVTSAFDLLPASTATPEPEAEDEGPPIHVVKAGDTLGIISNLYGVTIDDIVEANGITNPNILSVGQQLVIPVGGLATVTPPPAAEPTASVLPSPIPTVPITVTQGSTETVSITAVVSPGALETEAVQIVNAGSEPVALLDWKLVDQQGHIYTFAQVTLFGDGAGILLHTGTGSDGATDVFWGQTEAVWEAGELVSLLAPGDDIIATFTVPPQE